MFNSSTKGIVVFIVCIVILIAFLCASIVMIVYLYQKRQLAYLKEMDELREKHRNALFLSQVEIQEQTFRNITRDIHNNIGNKLTSAREFLTTLSGDSLQEVKEKVNKSVMLLSAGMTDLRDIARSMSSEIIANNGLIKALEFEVIQLRKTNLYSIDFVIAGEPIFLSGYQELILFRIAQEAIGNIIKHAKATRVNIDLQYSTHTVRLSIKDNGIGFDPVKYVKGDGLIGVQKRAKLLHGRFQLTQIAAKGSSTVKV
ncbi:MAG: ATP-binding protein [Ferruginibacter sp.]